MHQQTAIIIAGPTAAGKTELAIRIARQLDTEIISADARQCYRELNIGVARPTPEELAAVSHHFIASHGITERINAAVFEQFALREAERILRDRAHVVLCGGTGLYLRAFCEGMDDMPEVPEEIRMTVEAMYQAEGLQALQAAVAFEDPRFAEDGAMDNPARIIRALSFVRATGRSIRTFQRRQPAARPFRIIKLLVDRPRAELYDRINRRVTYMMEEGLWEEAEGLFTHRSLQALQTVGYRELFDHMEGRYSREAAVDLIRQHTRNYAKRQLTWFQKETGMKVFHPGQFDEIMKYLASQGI
ncbi:MAG: tRNA (adenosine(37)-N6)-dimethylallyltransferase MiaA [Chitinophagaceae bacterium]|jgi:tRNA dimethylallyltransferase